MGCITGCGRVILILLNLMFLMISLALVAAGVLLRFFINKFAEPLLGAVNDGLGEKTKKDFNIPDLDSVSELPFVGDIGIALIAFGSVLFLVSFLACCGACCRWRPLLILFVILMSILVISQATVGGLFLSKDSVLHDSIQDTVGDKVKDDFDPKGDDVFSFSINIMQYLVECCGIRGWEDYPKYKPPSCCLKKIVDGNSNNPPMRLRQLACTNDPPYAPPTDYNSQGCYKVLQDKALSNIILAAIILAVILVLQVLEIIFAILIIKDVNDDGNKVGPY